MYRVSLFSIALPFAICGSALYGQQSLEPPFSVDGLIQRQISGEVINRRSELQAVRLDNKADTLHWLKGEMLSGEKWIEVETANTKPTAKLEAYLSRRNTVPYVKEGHRSLAKWCEENKLPDQARGHWHGVLNHDANDAEARMHLKHVFLHDRWFTDEELDRAQETIEYREASIAKWQSKLRHITRLLRSTSVSKKNEALEQLNAIDDPSVIPAIEYLLLNEYDLPFQPFIRAISSHRNSEAATSLANLAISCDSLAIRDAASSELKSYPLEAFVPQVLECIPVPKQLTTRQEMSLAGELLVVQTFRSLKSNKEVKAERSELTRPADIEVVAVRNMTLYPKRGGVEFGTLLGPVHPLNEPNRDLIIDGYADVDQQRYASVEKARRNERLNDIDSSLHIQDAQRYYRLLRVTTGLDISDDQQSWYTWWQEYNQRHSTAITQERSSYSVVSQSRPYYCVKCQIAVNNSCLVAGTEIQTEFGLLPVESIRIGDRVVAQDVITGEITLKPVLQTTVRPAGKTWSIVTSQETIQATPGHRWWVAGKGWLMTNQLAKGMTLHAASSTIAVEDVKEDGQEQETYNLVVDRFHTYFVGKARVLSYDNSPPVAVMANVPGERLLAKAATKR